jgi:hypothetical protein
MGIGTDTYQESWTHVVTTYQCCGAGGASFWWSRSSKPILLRLQLQLRTWGTKKIYFYKCHNISPFRTYVLL